MTEPVKNKKVKKTEQVDKKISEDNELKNQLNYAQKLINILQNKVNELNATTVQLEAQLILVNEDKQNILKQVEGFGITPQE